MFDGNFGRKKNEIRGESKSARKVLKNISFQSKPCVDTRSNPQPTIKPLKSFIFCCGIEFSVTVAGES